MSPETATLAAGSRFEGRYEIQGELGSGSSGRVYQARQLATEKTVALKLLSPRQGGPSVSGLDAERFRREMQIGACLSHTNIVELIDRGETRDGQLYAAFVHVDGETLEQALAREGRLEVREALRLLTQVLDALACAHAKGIVHRDLKPSNLMLSGTGARRNALVLDFGLGGLTEGARRKRWRSLTQSGAFVGTPLYAAPEQLAGDPATPRSDLYAWGLVFLECLTGRHPFAEGDALYRGDVEIPTWLRSHRLGELLAKVTTRDPAKRDVSAEDLTHALDEIARGELPVAPEAPDERRPPPLSQSGERRHLTVMFCDLVDSTGLAQRLGAERYLELVQTYHATSQAALERYGGHVAQYLGDGLLVYFGHPQAHEDDAARAVGAGREILRELAALEPTHGERVAARIGVHSGPVVVSEVGSRAKKETLALGDTPTVASRLQAIAEPDTLVVSDATLRLMAGLFVTEDLGTPPLKGIEEPIRVHRVLEPSGVASRLDRAPQLSPFVGREPELGLLSDRFEQAQENRGQVVLIAGEAGIGKSRLVHELHQRLRETRHTWLECRGSPFEQQSAFQPVIELLERGLDFRAGDTAEQKLARLERGLANAGLEPAEAVPLVAGLLSLPPSERHPPHEMAPKLRRQKILETLLGWVLALGEKQPLVLLVEDLHWLDPSTLEWLGLLVDQSPTAGLLLLLTHRPEFESPWPAREHVLPISLRRLRPADAKRLVTASMGETTLPDALIERLAARADGIPLFVEELTRSVIESGGRTGDSLSELEIPATLHDSLTARLDRLGDAKPVAQLGAALGREFPYALIDSVAPMPEAALQEALVRLAEAEVVYPRGLPPGATYTFKHALVQDAAYQSLLESQRRELHARIADALEERFAERVARQPEEIARHCEESGRTAQAIGHYQRAGERAAQRFAHAEAISHLSKAIDLLRALPETAESRQQELRLQVALGAPLQASRGMYSDEVGAAYERALSLTEGSDTTPERFQALSGLAIFHRNREVTRALELGEELLAHAERTRDPAQLLFAHSTLGLALHYRGHFSQALGHHQQALALYDPIEHRSLEFVYGLDPGITSLCLASFALLQLGYPDRALEQVEGAIEKARALGHPYSLAYSLNWAAIVNHTRGEPRRVLERAEEAIAISSEHGLTQQLGGASLFRAWGLSCAASPELASRAVDAFQTKAPRRMEPVSAPFRGALADAQRRLGRLDEALDIVDSWLAFSTAKDARYWDAEFLRLRGEIRLAQDPEASEEASDCFSRGISLANDQECRYLELRVATSLARLMRDQGRREEARARLEPVYAWFTEGFDTQDLKDAKALLEEL